MKLPKYETFSIIGIINIIIGIYIYQLLTSKGLGFFTSIAILIIYDFITIALYDRLRKELEKED